MEVLDRHDVEVAIAVDVAHHMALQAFGVVSTDVMPPKVSGTVVLQPVEGIVSEGVGARQVHVAVAIQVRGSHAEGIGVAVEDQVLGKSGRLSRQGRAETQRGQDKAEQNRSGAGRRSRTFH